MRRVIASIILLLALCLGRTALAIDAHPEGAKAGAASETATQHPGGHEEVGLLPDFERRETWLSALWVVIIFLVLVVVLSFTAWKNVLAGLKAREERIRKDIADAEASRLRAEATLREYNTQLAAAETRVREMLNNATRDGEKIATELRMRAQKEAEESKTRATREIETAKQQALAEIYQTAAELSTSIAEKILRRSINADDQKDLVKRSLDELQTVGG